MSTNTLIAAHGGSGKTEMAKKYKMVDLDYAAFKYQDGNRALPNPLFLREYYDAIKSATLNSPLTSIPMSVGDGYLEKIESDTHDFLDTQKLLICPTEGAFFDHFIRRYLDRGDPKDIIDKRIANFYRVLEFFNSAKNFEKIAVTKNLYLPEILASHGLPLEKI